MRRKNRRIVQPLKAVRSKTNSESTLDAGEIVAAFGRRFSVELADGNTLECVTRGRKSEFACGDQVQVQRTAIDQGVIETVLPRTSLLYRSDAFRQKLIAANVDQLIFVLATMPSYSEELLSRCLIAAEATGINAIVVLNKADLAKETKEAQARLAWLTDLGYPLLPLSAIESIAPLHPYLEGKLSVLVGQSGMGKSTIINALIPGAAARVNEFSEALDSGKHTTTNARIYRIDAKTRIIDSPGLQEFGLFHINDDELAHALPELRSYLGQCRFHNCRHVSEPDCVIRAAGQAGKIRTDRLALYQRLVTSHGDWRATQKAQGR